MDTTIKKIALFVPAWFPCSFFEEQQNTYKSEYEVINIYGTCEWLSKKKQIREILSFKSNYYLMSSIANRLIEVAVRCPKRKKESSWANTISRISERIGQLVLSETHGKTPNVIYIQSVSEIAIFVAEWARKNGIPIVLAEHVLYIRRGNDYITRRKEKLYSSSNQVFCVSNYLYRNLLTSGFNMQSVKIVGNLINSYAVPEDWNMIKKNGKIIFVAGHISDKDMPTFCKVANRLFDSNVSIDIYGLTGEERIGNNCLRDNVYNNVTFMGKVSHKMLLEKYNEYSLLLSTSISETFGLSVAEAIAHGTPVVCTDSGGICDFVNDNNGMIVNVKDVDAIITAINVVMHRQYDCKRMSSFILKQYGVLNYMKNTRLDIL